MGDRKPTAMRNDEIYAKRMGGASLAALAEEYGLSAGAVCTIVRNVARSLPERDRSELVAATMETLATLHAKAMEIADMGGAPVTAGTRGDILIDPETGETVRDFGGVLAAIKTVLAVDAQYAKRLGLDAPSESTVKAQVHYQITGLNPEDLT